jgi:glycogen operon protein
MQCIYNTGCGQCSTQRTLAWRGPRPYPAAFAIAERHSVLGELHLGRHEPLGTCVRDGGVNFAFACTQPGPVELCVFEAGARERRWHLHGPRDGVCHGFLPGAAPGLAYAFRAAGEYQADPYAREAVADAEASAPARARVPEPLDEAPGLGNRPRLRDEDLLLYELVPEDFSRLHPDIPEELRGRHRALAHDAAIEHFRMLGVNALLLTPARSLFASGDLAGELRALSVALHSAGIEVLVDVDLHGLALADARGLRLALDSLRAWMRDTGLDGFRLRGTGRLDAQSPFFLALRQDPLLASARLLAVQADAPGGFPGRFQEWNAGFRDVARRYWLRDGVGRGEFARRFAASADLFAGRPPVASVNFVAAQDGLGLADAVSRARAGDDAEPSANLGVEGPTDDRLVGALRRRLRRALMATLLLAQGTPALCAGDELGASRGKGESCNPQVAYPGLDWAGADAAFCQFTAEAAALRRAEPLLRPASRLGATRGHGPSLHWLLPTGAEPAHADWQEPQARALACLLDSGVDLPAEGSARLLLLFNPEPQEAVFALPDGDWRLALDSSGLLAGRSGRMPPQLPVPAHALLLLRVRAPEANPLGKK